MAVSLFSTLEDLEAALGGLESKRILVRCDFNVPIKDGGIADDMRIRAALPTLLWLLERGASVVIGTHFGRPEGKYDERYSTQLLKPRVEELAPGVELLENLRFNAGEVANDQEFVDFLIGGAGGQAPRACAARQVPRCAARALREVEGPVRLPGHHAAVRVTAGLPPLRAPYHASGLPPRCTSSAKTAGSR